MSRINYRRKDTWKIRKPTPTKPNKAITPDSIYDRNKAKEHFKHIIARIKSGGYNEDDTT